MEHKLKKFWPEADNSNRVNFVLSKIGSQLLAENNNNYEKILSNVYFDNGKPRIRGFFEENISHDEKKEIECKNIKITIQDTFHFISYLVLE